MSLKGFGQLSLEREKKLSEVAHHEPGGSQKAYYEALLAEKEARIAELEARIVKLETLALSNARTMEEETRLLESVFTPRHPGTGAAWWERLRNLFAPEESPLVPSLSEDVEEFERELTRMIARLKRSYELLEC